MIRLLMICAALAGPAHSATYGFCWRGANDYRLEGYISYPDDFPGRIVTQDDVTGFGIVGWRGDTYLGRWSLKELTPETSWVLRFDTRALAFPTGGDRLLGTYQAWNANGRVDDCGDPGFGFNGGNVGQDVCVNGRYIAASTIDPTTPLRIAANPADPCGPAPMSALPGARRHG
ncbi:hypothetical protein [Jannaschia seohaensis]|uniref:Uncharacterized protein n=1 Tax=Jannaschia seohaensis TaxID=475081 RepID=A0A2Y9A2E3_9RHOB|nr:hypothetical protein [Jannaschia seohaensis]PWJ22167.1 hypothetical protein BCF38_101577 [Jannaschia seohaensis]SSA38445.1 hypothetical protein SAMN05421539_101577 [Jannaschia seohaensis]